MDERPKGSLQIKGGPDRDARNVPYGWGNRAQRRKMNAELNKAAKDVRKVKR